MKFHTLEIENFRSFYGDNEIDFAIDGPKNVTMVFGTNGGGKSSLMNALQWCLFKKLLPGTDKPKQLRHEQCKETDAYGVTIKIENKGKLFEIDRGWNTAAENYFHIKPLDKNGITGPRIENPEDFLKKLIPEDILNWFFYSDEDKLDKINLEGGIAFKAAVRQVQGFTLIDQLINDLEGVRKKKEAQIAKQSSSADVQKIIAAMSEIDKERETVTGKSMHDALKDLKEEIDVQEIKQRRIDNDLGKLPDAADFKKAINEAQNDKKTHNAELKEKLEARGYMYGGALTSIFLTKRAAKQPQIKIDTKTKAVLVKKPYGKTLLETIIVRGECICGNKDIKNPSKGYTALQELLPQADDDALRVQERVYELNTALKEINNFTETFPSRQKSIEGEIEKIQALISKQETIISNNEAEIAKLANNDKKVASLRSILQDLKKQIDAKRSTYYTNKVRLDNLNTDYAKLEVELSKNQAVSQSSNDSQKLFDLTNKLLIHAKDKLVKDEKTSMDMLSKQYNLILKEGFLSTVSATIDPQSYKVEILGEDEKKYIFSTGEKEMAQYLFMAAIHSLTKEGFQQSGDYLATQLSAPLILDAPYSTMDKPYQEKACDVLIKYINQVVFLGLPSSFKNFQDHIKPHVGKAYALVKGIPDLQDANNTQAELKIYGKNYNLINYDTKINPMKTIIKEIKV